MRKFLLTGLIAICFSTASWANGSATMESGGQRMQVEYLASMVRVNMDDAGKNYLVVRDGRMYSVMEGQVYDATSMMESFAGSAPSPTSDIGKFHGLKSTGRKETHGGVTGEVFELDFSDEKGTRRQAEIVLSSDQRARDLQKAFNTMSSTMASAMGKDHAAEMREMERMLGNRGILRFENDMKVVSLSGSAPAQSRFELPSKPQDMGGVGSALSEMFGGKAERQQDRASRRTESEVDSATDRAVDRALDRLFGR